VKKVWYKLDVIRNLGLCLFILIFTSCDPAQTIQFANQTDDTAVVMVIFKKGDHIYKFVAPTESDTLIINLEPKNQHSARTFQFGLGTWKIQSSIDSLIAAMELIEIRTSKSTERYQGEKQIRTFIEDRIAGSRKELIEIELK
jgi:hypothetical protein